MRALLHDPVARLRAIGLLEGCTLVLLLCVAVPLRHLAGWPTGARIMGPVHGIVFVMYLVALIDNFAGGGWRGRDMLRTGIAGLLPFGTFFNDAFLARRRA